MISSIGIKKMKWLSLMLSVFLIPAFAGSVSALQKPNIHTGRLELHPFISLKQSYESNIFLEPAGEEDEDFITNLTIGVQARMPVIPQREEDFILQASYYMSVIEFWDHDEPSRVDHLANGLLDFKFANDLRLKIGDDFLMTADPPNSERTTLDKRYRNIFNSSLSYDREKIMVQGGYRLTRDDYNDIDSLDKTDNMFTAAFFYQIYPKTSVFTEYNYGTILYDTNLTNSDSEYNQIRIGVTGNLRSKLTGTVKAGYRDVAYEESGKNDFSSLTLFGDINYAVKERTGINLYALRTSLESSYSTNSYFETNKIGFKIDHQFSERLWFDGGSFIQWNRYPAETTEGTETQKRRDTLWDFDAVAKYEIREWWFINGGYEFNLRESNFSVLDYDDHKISAQMTVAF